MTPFKVVNAAFLTKILEDDYGNWTPAMMEADMFDIMKSAIDWFKFPRVSLEYDENGFIDDLNNDEVQIIATYMKCEWIERTIATYENIKPLYEERDFSQANLLDKLRELQTATRAIAQKREANYYRSVRKKPFNYAQLATRT